jgi:hypothetical protein
MSFWHGSSSEPQHSPHLVQTASNSSSFLRACFSYDLTSKRDLRLLPFYELARDVADQNYYVKYKHNKKNDRQQGKQY